MVSTAYDFWHVLAMNLGRPACSFRSFRSSSRSFSKVAATLKVASGHHKSSANILDRLTSILQPEIPRTLQTYSLHQHSRSGFARCPRLLRPSWGWYLALCHVQAGCTKQWSSQWTPNSEALELMRMARCYNRHAPKEALVLCYPLAAHHMSRQPTLSGPLNTSWNPPRKV